MSSTRIVKRFFLIAFAHKCGLLLCLPLQGKDKITKKYGKNGSAFQGQRYHRSRVSTLDDCANSFISNDYFFNVCFEV